MRRDRYVPQEPPYLLYALLGVSLAMNLYMVLDRDTVAPVDEPVSVLEVEAADPSLTLAQVAPGTLVDAVPEASSPPVAQVGVTAALVTPPSVQVPETTATPAIDRGGYSLLTADVSHSLARTVQGQTGDDADVLTAVFSRIFMWDLDLRRDVQRGDELAMVYGPGVDSANPDLPIATYKSNKLGETLRAYAYQAPGDRYSSYWDANGVEVPRRLVGGPIEDYAQITSLLKDRPNHHGIDFKADVGTDVFSPKAGTVTRVNWNTGANGGCVEVRFADGTLARFLHLSEPRVKKGQHVKAGQTIALSGNSGNSTAPHLHYELSRGKKYLDPLDYHGTVRRGLEESTLPAFRREVARLDGLLGESFAAR